MIFLKPMTVTTVKLNSSIPEPDAAQGEVVWSAGTYNLGQRVIKTSNHSVYEVVADPSTTDEPEVGAAKKPATWVRVGATNRYKMFDVTNNTSSTGEDIVIEFTPIELVNSVACFNVLCSSATVKAFNGAGAEIYNKEIELKTRPLVNGWFNYYYSGFSIIDKFVLIDLPPITDGKIQITFSGGASVGTCVFGEQVTIGDAQWGTGAEQLDFRPVNEDQFGNLSYGSGFKAKLVNYDVMVDTPLLDSAYSSISNLGDYPTVFIGNPSSIGDVTLAYGFVRDLNVTYTTPIKSNISLTVRGVI